MAASCELDGTVRSMAGLLRPRRSSVLTSIDGSSRRIEFRNSLNQLKKERKPNTSASSGTHLPNKKKKKQSCERLESGAGPVTSVEKKKKLFILHIKKKSKIGK